MFKPLRKEKKFGGNNDATTNVEEKVIRLNGVDFHKQDVSQKIRKSYAPPKKDPNQSKSLMDTLVFSMPVKAIPGYSESYNIKLRDLRRPKKKN